MVEAIAHSAFAITTTHVHIKWHQDDDALMSDLSLLAQMNVEADKYASEYRHQIWVVSTNYTFVPHTLSCT